MVYRAYLRTFDGQVSHKTLTHDPSAADAAFRALVMRTDLDGQKLAAALTGENRQIAYHRFDRAPGDADYWRDRLDAIPWPGGAPPSAEDDTPDGKTLAPTPAEIIAARRAADHTQTEAADLIHCARGTWAKWERGEREMHPAFWRLYRILTGQDADYQKSSIDS